ncbi:MAG: hypothetical protein RSD85_00710 [Erysipelotrichaceae bacterium]
MFTPDKPKSSVKVSEVYACAADIPVSVCDEIVIMSDAAIIDEGYTFKLGLEVLSQSEDRIIVDKKLITKYYAVEDKNKPDTFNDRFYCVFKVTFNGTVNGSLMQESCYVSVETHGLKRNYVEGSLRCYIDVIKGLGKKTSSDEDILLIFEKFNRYEYNLFERIF